MLQTFTKDDRLREQYRLHEEFLRVQRTEQIRMKMLNEKYLKEKLAKESALKAKEKESLKKIAALKAQDAALKAQDAVGAVPLCLPDNKLITQCWATVFMQ